MDQIALYLISYCFFCGLFAWLLGDTVHGRVVNEGIAPDWMQTFVAFTGLIAFIAFLFIMTGMMLGDAAGWISV